MNKLIITAFVIFTSTACINIYGQGGAPPGASDKNLEDRDVKTRSNEMERIKREDTTPSSGDSNAKFPEIKEDFEKMQLVDVNIMTLAKTKTPDYKQISDASAEIKKRATRLKLNLFGPPPKKKDKDKAKDTGTADSQPQDVKTLIVGMDKSIADFANSPIFQNTKVADPKDSQKAQSDLENVIKLSAALEVEADKRSKDTP